MYTYDKTMFALFIVTAVICVVNEPTNGIVIGAKIGLLIFASHNSKAHGELIVQKGRKYVGHLKTEDIDERDLDETNMEAQSVGDILIYRIPGDLTYLNAPAHIERAKKLPTKYTTIILSLRYLFYLDLDGLGAIGDMVRTWEKIQFRHVLITGARETPREMLEKTKWFQEKVESHMVYTTFKDALIAAQENESSCRSLDTKSYFYYEEMEA
jgi:MFS superfamily sulfate permease-like transporter